MIPVDTVVGEHLRGQFRAVFASAPNPRMIQDADELADLTYLAVRSAVEAIDRVANTASSQEASMCILSAATSGTICALTLLQEAMHAYAAEQGMPLHQGTVNMSGARS